MVNHSRSRSPNPIKSSSHPPVQTPPMIDIFLDPSLIPSLPSPSGHIGHHELMERPRFLSANTSRLDLNPGDVFRPVPLQDGVVSGMHPFVVAGNGLHRRSSSLEVPVPGKRAGIGAGLSFQDTAGASASANHLGPPRPAAARRVSSFENRKPVSEHDVLSPKPKGAKASIGRHQRTASDSRSDTLTPERDGQPPLSMSLIPSFLATYDEGYIRLRSDRDPATSSKLLLTLSALTPPDRVVGLRMPPPASGILHPSAMLTPLAIILEALVAERSVLQSVMPAPLPFLRDGSSLQLQGGEGELDWTVMQPYILAVGSVISQLTPYLQRSKDEPEVKGLSKGLRVYIGKQKKVFGEVASMYVDGYGFMRGWWDEGGMKGCAGEIGKWGDMVDA